MYLMTLDEYLTRDSICTQCSLSLHKFLLIFIFGLKPKERTTKTNINHVVSPTTAM